MPAPTIADIWAMTPAEMDRLLRYAAWMVRYSTGSTGADRVVVESNLRRAAAQVNPTAYTSMDGAAEHYRPGVYNGD